MKLNKLFAEITNLYDQDFLPYNDESLAILHWINRHKEDIENIENDYIEQIHDLKEQLKNAICPKFKKGSKVWAIFDEIRGDEFWYTGNDKELQNYAVEVRDLFLDKVNNDFEIHQGILEIIKEQCRDAVDFVATSIEYKVLDAIYGPYKTMLMAIEYYVIK